MDSEHILIWNVRGLNSRARRNVVRNLAAQERVSLITLQETKLDNCTDSLVMEMLGVELDYLTLPASHTCGGILLGWKRDVWAASGLTLKANSLTT